MITTVEGFRSYVEEVNITRCYEEPINEKLWDEILKYPELRIWAAHNKNVPIRVLEVLSKNSDSRVRIAVAMKQKLTFELFNFLADDKDEGVRLCIIRNKKIPLVIIDKMVNDEWEKISELAKTELAKRML